MNNKPVAYAMFRDGEYYDAIHPDEQAKTVGEYDIPLYTHQYERPHNTVLVPCDKLAEMQAEIEALKTKYEADYAKAFENGYAIGLSHGKDLINNGEI